MPIKQKIRPCLGFDTQAEEAAKFYTSIFKNSKITHVSYYGDAGYEAHGMKKGTVMVVIFELDGMEFMGLNGGPYFKFTEGVSLQIECEDQAEVDYYWDKLTEGGDPAAQMCGWVKDKFGLSWQITPVVLEELMSSADPETAGRVMEAMIKMKKIDVEIIKNAAKG